MLKQELQAPFLELPLLPVAGESRSLADIDIAEPTVS